MRSTFLLSTVLASLVLATPAFAQDESEAPEEEPAPKPKKKAKPAPPPAADTSAAASGQTDHDRVVGRLGIGYLGSLDVPLGGTAGPTRPAHILGMRYWLGPGMGITAGLGFSNVSGSTTNGNTTVDSPAATAFAVKGGLPLALATSKHFAFVIEPQFVFGYATQTITQPNLTIDNTGQRFALGATAGAEIQFGFMGIPELSLVGSVGLAFDTAGGKTKPSTGGESSYTATQISTFTLANPWDIFRGSIAAIYYL